MTTTTDARSIEVNRGLLMGGVVMMSAGALLGVVGGLATTAALVSGVRAWVRQLDEPPAATARRMLAQTRTAAAAGAAGWRQHAQSLASAQNGGNETASSVPD